MDLLLDDKTALVVAASNGIGKGVAMALAREGCRVIITSSQEENLARAENEIQKETNADVISFVMDLRSSSSIDDAADKILKTYHGVDILVTNSPGPRLMEAATVDIAALLESLGTNLVSVVQLCRKFTPVMIENRFGRIINLASTTGLEPDADLVLSNIARAGVLAYSKTLSREVGQYGITVNSILTGSVMTKRAINLMMREAGELNIPYSDYLVQAAESIPAGFISTPEQFCHAIAFLASPVSMYVNGISLPIDGGFMRSI